PTVKSPAELSAILRGANMTTLQDTAVGPASQDEPRAPIAILSPAKRNALVACFNAGGLHKKDGAWHGLPGGKPVSGMTTADLARDGMLTVTTNHRFGSARLTERGRCFVREPLRAQKASVLEVARPCRRGDRPLCASRNLRMSRRTVSKLARCGSKALRPKDRSEERESATERGAENCAIHCRFLPRPVLVPAS